MISIRFAAKNNLFFELEGEILLQKERRYEIFFTIFFVKFHDFIFS